MEQAELKKGNCFWRHTWTMWTEYVATLIHIKTKIECNEIRQKRRCVKCGYTEDVYISG